MINLSKEFIKEVLDSKPGTRFIINGVRYFKIYNSETGSIDLIKDNRVAVSMKDVLSTPSRPSPIDDPEPYYKQFSKEEEEREMELNKKIENYINTIELTRGFSIEDEFEDVDWEKMFNYK